MPTLIDIVFGRHIYEERKDDWGTSQRSWSLPAPAKDSPPGKDMYGEQDDDLMENPVSWFIIWLSNCLKRDHSKSDGGGRFSEKERGKIMHEIYTEFRKNGNTVCPRLNTKQENAVRITLENVEKAKIPLHSMSAPVRSKSASLMRKSRSAPSGGKKKRRNKTKKNKLFK